MIMMLMDLQARAFFAKHGNQKAIASLPFHEKPDYFSPSKHKASMLLPTTTKPA
jgi:hypothetical protein